jgi:organic radical activating enzyme
MNSKTTGYLSEMFTSIQGEGPWIGTWQMFIRLAGCTANCAYCDTKYARNPRPTVWKLKGLGEAVKSYQHANPIAVEDLIRFVQTVNNEQGPLYAVSITGGEPLEQPIFLNSLLREIRKECPSLKILLETNGLDAETMRACKDAVDLVSMDIKIPSSSGQPVSSKKYEDFFSSCLGLAGCVKVVFNQDTTCEEIAEAAKMSSRWSPGWDFILQPMSGLKWPTTQALTHLNALIRIALAHNSNTRVIPQIHKLLGLL